MLGVGGLGLGAGVRRRFSQAIFCCHFSVCYVGVEKRACKCVHERVDTKERRKSKIECEDPFRRTCPTDVDLM